MYLSAPMIALNHHGSRSKTGQGDPSTVARGMPPITLRDRREAARHEENERVGLRIRLQLNEAHFQRSVKAQRCC